MFFSSCWLQISCCDLKKNNWTFVQTAELYYNQKNYYISLAEMCLWGDEKVFIVFWNQSCSSKYSQNSQDNFKTQIYERQSLASYKVDVSRPKKCYDWNFVASQRSKLFQMLSKNLFVNISESQIFQNHATCNALKLVDQNFSKCF